MARARTHLREWKYRLTSDNGVKEASSIPEIKDWSSVTSFPSVVQAELVAKKLIPDPYIGENERVIQWVGQCDWEYRTSFKNPNVQDECIDLVFEGLDTFATVSLNGKEILSSDNQFLPARVSVKDLLKEVGEKNELAILFQSAYKKGIELEKIFGPRTSMMRDRRRMHVRKAQYAWGWDWGPIVMTMGPWLPIYIETYSSRIDNVHIRQNLSPDQSTAEIEVITTLKSTDTSATCQLKITDAAGAEVASAPLSVNDNKATAKVTIESPKLWWPNGQGQQHLYSFVVNLNSSDHVLDTFSSKVGIRTVEVVQRPLKDAPGKTFLFRVNGRDIFINGGNWIPADNLLTNISRQRYFDWVKLGAFGHLNMIRVWGGGIYESEDFFDACDEYGILVWHDYAFACGDYPIHKEFLQNITKETEAQTIRLRNRTSLALICGGNEDFMLAKEWNKLDFDMRDTKGPFEDTVFPQRKIYLDVLPKVINELAPDSFYWPNSPYGGTEGNDTTEGDIHQWSVWHLEQKPYQEYKTLAGRFVSEFGMHGFPVQRTVNYFTRGGKKGDLHAQSRLIDCHNKGHGAHTRIARYLAENFRFDMTNLKNFIYGSQLMQSEAYAYALRDWKRMFNGAGDERCAGAIIWQLNDVYPGTSWAYVDYYLRPKPAFYPIRRAFAPIFVGVERTPGTRWVDEDKPEVTKIPSFELYGHNTTAGDVKGTLQLRAYDFATNTWTELGADEVKGVTFKAGRNTELGKLEAKTEWKWNDDSLIILEVSFVDSDGKILARHVDWPEPYRYLNWPENTGISINIQDCDDGDWEQVVTVNSEQPLKGVWLEPIYDGTEKDDDREPLWDDNMVDLMPGKAMHLKVSGLKGRKVAARFLYDWETEHGKAKKQSSGWFGFSKK